MRILLLEDAEADAELILLELRRGGIEHVSKCVAVKDGFLAALGEFKPELILADYSLPGFSGMEALAISRVQCPDVPVIMVTGSLGEEVAVETIKRGATDYILKNRLWQLVPAVFRALRETAERKQRRQTEVLLEVKHQQLSLQNEAFQRSEERFRQLAEAIREVFWMTSVDKNQMLYVSPGYETIWGRSCQSLYASSKEWVESIHPEDRDRVLEAAVTKQALGSYHEEYRIMRPDGLLRWIQDRAFPIRNEAGEVYRIAGIAEDITARKQAERDLQQAEAKYRTIFENASEGIFQITPEGRYLSANPALARMLGFDSPTELLATITDFGEQMCVEPGSRAELKRRLEREGQVHGFENRIYRKDRSVIWVNVNARVVRNGDGAVMYYEGTSQDITERKLAEKRLAAEHAVTRAVAESSTLQESSMPILQAICECLGSETGAIWEMDRKANKLRCIEVWCGAPGAVQEFKHATNSASFGPGEGFAGRVWQAGKALWVTDLSSEPILPRAPIAIRCGLHASVGVPIMLKGQVFGVLEFFSREIRQPDTALLNCLSALSDQIGQFIGRKQAEAQIATLAHAVESTVEMICITDLEDRFIFVNRAFQETYGYTEAEILGRRPGILLSPNNPPPLLEEILESTRAGYWRGEVLDLRKNGTEIPVFLTTSQIRDDSGRVIGLMGVAQDITARKAADRQIRMLADAVQSTQEIISVTDIENRFTFVNQAFLLTYGYSEAEVLGQTPNILYSEKNPPGLCDEVFEQTVRGAWKGEILNIRKDGTELPISLNTSQIKDAEGRVIGLMGVGRDNSERQRGEKQKAAFSMLGHRLSAVSEPEQAAKIILDIAAELFGWDAGYVYSYSRAPDKIVPLFTVDTFGGKRVPVSEASLPPEPSPMMRLTMSEGARLIDAGNESSLAVELRPFGDANRRSASRMFVPIQSEGSVVGILSIQSYTAGVYSEEDLRLLQSMADRCGDAFQRIKVAKALSEAEARYRNIFENATEGIFQTSPDGRYLSANPALARMFGYQSPEELISSVTNIERQTFVSQDSAQELERFLEGQDSVLGFETERYRKDGSKCWTSINVRRVCDPDGSLRYYEGTVQEITRRKRAQRQSAALTRLGYGLSAVITPEQAASVILDIASDLFGWDAGYLHLYSQAEDKIIRVRTMDTVDGQRVPTPPPRSTSDPSPMMRLVMKEGARMVNAEDDSSLSVRLLPFGNANRRSACRMYVPIHSMGSVVGILSIQSRTAKAYSEEDLRLLQTMADHCGDAFQRIKVTEALRKAEAEYRSIFENASEGIFRTSPEGRLLSANPALARMFGYASAEEMISIITDVGRQMYATPALRDQFKGLLAAHGSVQGFEAEGQRKDGGRIWTSLNAHAVRDGAGAILYFEGTGQDITTRKRSEKRSAAFSRLGYGLTSAITPGDAARMVLDVASDLFGWDAGYVDLYSKAEDKIIPVLTMDTVGGQRIIVPPESFSHDPSPMMRVVMAQGPQLYESSTQPAGAPAMIPFGDTGRRSASGMFVTIRAGEEVFGILSIQSYIHYAYGPHDLKLLQALADYCSDTFRRIKMTESLRDAEAKYRGIFENATEGIFQSTPDGHIAGANPALAHILGYKTPEELISSATDLQRQIYVSPERRAEFKHALESQGNVHGFEAENYRKDGSKIWVSVNARVVRDDSGRVRYYEGTIQDVTRRNQTEAILRESERKLRLIAENTREVFFLFDMERRPLYANPAVQELTGYSFDEIKANGFIDWMHPDDRERMIGHWEALYAGKSYSDVEFRMVARTGEVKWCSSSWGPTYDETGRQIGVQGIEQDVSERKQLECEVLESANNERRRIGHELHDSLCQYLAGIAFRAKALEQTLAGQGHEHAATAAELVTFLGNSISQARSLARGLDPVEIETIGLPAALQNLAAETEKFFNLSCRFQFPEPAISLNHQTSMVLFRIVQEAIHNAITHGGAGRIDIALETDSESLCLRVQDDGSGFDPGKAQSDGMGLRVMQYRARSIGAKLEVSSNPGQGTQIRCLVPLGKARKTS